MNLRWKFAFCSNVPLLLSKIALFVKKKSRFHSDWCCCELGKIGGCRFPMSRLVLAGFFHFVMHLFTRTHNTHWLCGWWRWLFHNQVAGFSSIPVKSFGSQWKSQSLLSAAVFNCQGSPVIEEGFRRSSSDVKMKPRLRKCCLEMDFGLPAAWPWGGTTRGATKVNYYKYSRLDVSLVGHSSSVV